MAPYRNRARGFHRKFIQVWLARKSRHSRYSLRVAYCYAFPEAALSRPLRYPGGQVSRAVADLPSFICKFNDRPHRPRTDDAPLAVGDIGHPDHIAIHPRSDRARTQGRAHVVDIARNRRFFLILVALSTKHLQIKTAFFLAPKVHGVAFVKIKPPGSHL